MISIPMLCTQRIILDAHPRTAYLTVAMNDL